MLAVTVNVVTVGHINAAFHKVTRAVAGSEPNVEACTGMTHQGCSFGKVIQPFIVTQYGSQGIVQFGACDVVLLITVRCVELYEHTGVGYVTVLIMDILAIGINSGSDERQAAAMRG